jgi:HD-like signal output (HDOD) protein
LGRLILFMKKPTEIAEVFRRSKGNYEPMYIHERHVLGYDHAELGGVLLECWNFPSSLVNAVRHHHDPVKAGQDSADAGLVHLGDILAHAMEFGGSGEKHVPPCESQIRSKLGLGTEVLRSSMMEIDRQFDDVVEMFLHDQL